MRSRRGGSGCDFCANGTSVRCFNHPAQFISQGWLCGSLNEFTAKLACYGLVSFLLLLACFLVWFVSCIVFGLLDLSFCEIILWVCFSCSAGDPSFRRIIFLVFSWFLAFFVLFSCGYSSCTCSVAWVSITERPQTALSCCVASRCPRFFRPDHERSWIVSVPCHCGSTDGCSGAQSAAAGVGQQAVLASATATHTGSFRAERNRTDDIQTSSRQPRSFDGPPGTVEAAAPLASRPVCCSPNGRLGKIAETPEVLSCRSAATLANMSRLANHLPAAIP